MDMRRFTLKLFTLISITALMLKFTGRFREQMEKERCTLHGMNHMAMEITMNFWTEGSLFMSLVSLVLHANLV